MSKKLKAKNINKKKPFPERLLKLLMGLSIAGISISIFLAIAPVQAFLMGLFIYVLGAIIAIILAVFTLGLAFIPPEVKSFFGNWFNTGKSIMNGSDQFKKFISVPYPYLVSVIGVIIISFLVLSIVYNNRYKKSYKSKVVVSIVFTCVYVACTIYSAMYIMVIK